MNIYISLIYFNRFSFIMFLMLFWLLTKDPSFFLCLTWATSKRMASADRLILQTSYLALEVIRKSHNLCYFNYLLKKYHDSKNTDEIQIWNVEWNQGKLFHEDSSSELRHQWLNIS